MTNLRNWLVILINTWEGSAESGAPRNHAEESIACFVVASKERLSEKYVRGGPCVCLGDGQTEAEGVASQGGRGGALHRRKPPQMTWHKRVVSAPFTYIDGHLRQKCQIWQTPVLERYSITWTSPQQYEHKSTCQSSWTSVVSHSYARSMFSILANYITSGFQWKMTVHHKPVMKFVILIAFLAVIYLKPTEGRWFLPHYLFGVSGCICY